jgi:hypothetical protein
MIVITSPPPKMGHLSHDYPMHQSLVGTPIKKAYKHFTKQSPCFLYNFAIWIALDQHYEKNIKCSCHNGTACSQAQKGVDSPVICKTIVNKWISSHRFRKTSGKWTQDWLNPIIKTSSCIKCHKILWWFHSHELRGGRRLQSLEIGSTHSRCMDNYILYLQNIINIKLCFFLGPKRKLELQLCVFLT